MGLTEASAIVTGGAVGFGSATDAPKAAPSAKAVGATSGASARAALPTFAGSTLPAVRAARGNAFGRLVAGELRILLRGVPGWWMLGAGAMTVAALLVLERWVAFPMLPLVWGWPVLIWSRLGTQQRKHDVHLLVDSGPYRRRRLVAELLAGLLLTALAGIGSLARMSLSAAWAGTAAWAGSLLFIPSLALGVLGRSGWLFQGVYLLLWYAVMNSMSSADFMGAIREGVLPGRARSAGGLGSRRSPPHGRPDNPRDPPCPEVIEP